MAEMKNTSDMTPRELQLVRYTNKLHEDLRAFCNQNVSEGYTVVINLVGTFLQNLSTHDLAMRKELTEAFVQNVYEIMTRDLHKTESNPPRN